MPLFIDSCCSKLFWGGNTKAAVTDDNLSVTIHFIAFFAIEWKWMVTEAFVRPTFLFVLNSKEKKTGLEQRVLCFNLSSLFKIKKNHAFEKLSLWIQIKPSLKPCTRLPMGGAIKQTLLVCVDSFYTVFLYSQSSVFLCKTHLILWYPLVKQLLKAKHKNTVLHLHRYVCFLLQ